MYSYLSTRPRPRRPALSPAPGSLPRLQPFQPKPLTAEQVEGLDSPDAAGAVDPMAPTPMWQQSSVGRAMAGNAAPIVKQEVEKARTMDAIGQIGQDAATPVTKFARMPSFQDAGGGDTPQATGADKVGTALNVANAGLGIAGAIMSATAKTPTVPTFQEFTPSLAPAVGMDPGQKQALINRITQNQLRAGQAVGPDANLTMATRLQAATNAGEQQMQVERDDQQLLQQNQQRRQELQFQVDQSNNQGRNAQRMAVFDQQSRQAEARRAQGTAMAQGALTYFTQQNAAQRQEQQDALQQQYQQQTAAKRSRYITLGQLLGSSNLTALQRSQYQAEFDALEAESSAGPQRTISTTTTVRRAAGGPVPVARFRRGGSLSFSQETTTGGRGRGAGVDIVAQHQQQFRKSMDQVTAAATRQFGAMLRDALRVRTQPLAGFTPVSGRGHR